MRSLVRVLILLGVFTIASATSAQDATPEGSVAREPRVDTSLPPTSVRVSGVVLDVGCLVTGALRAGERLVVSCAGGRVRTYTAVAGGTFSLVDERRASGDVTALFLADGVPWGLVEGRAQRIDYLPVVELAAAEAATSPSEPAAPEEDTTGAGSSLPSTIGPGTGTTSSSDGGAGPSAATPSASSGSSGATADADGSRRAHAAGSSDASRGAARAARAEAEAAASAPIAGATVLRFRGSHVVLAPDLPLSVGDHVDLVPADGTRHARVVGTVSSVTEDAIEVDIGYGEVVRVGDGVSPTRHGPTATLIDPPETRRTISVSGTLGILFDAAGIGTLDDLELVWRSDLPFALRVRVLPFSALFVGYTTDVPATGGALIGGGSVDAMLDTRYFGIGVGLGFGQYTTRISRTPVTPTSDQRVGFAVLPVMRIGPVDGLHLEVTGNILAVIDEFRFGGLDGRVRVPLIPGYWLDVRGGGWPSGLGFGEVGLRIAAEGNGGPGSIFVMPMIGFAGIDTGNHGFRSGPVVGFGIEGRLGQ